MFRSSKSNLVKLAVSAVVAAGFGFASCGGSAPAGKVRITGNDAYEASIFRQNCAICHGPEADGKVVDGRAIPSLRNGPALQKSEAEIYQQIAFGKLPMPAFRDQLTEREMRNMTRFIIEDLQGRGSNERSNEQGD